MVNFIRHNLSDYDEQLEILEGRILDLFNEITGDCKTLKILFIGLGIIILSTFAPVSATIIGITLLFAGLVRAFQYCYKEFD